jgi:hypothetical protein
VELQVEIGMFHLVAEIQRGGDCSCLGGGLQTGANAR